MTSAGDDGGDFACAGGGAWVGEDGASGCEDGGVFDEGGVGKLEVGGEGCDVEAALLEGFAVEGVLFENLVELRLAEVDGGEACGEVMPGRPDDCVLEQVSGLPG